MVNRKIIWIPPILWGILLAVLSLMPGKQGDFFLFGIPHIDKIGHFGMYAIWTFLVFHAWERNTLNPPVKVMWLTFLFGTLAGIVLEIGQFTITVGRTFEISDILANGLGSLIGVMAGKLLRYFEPKGPAS